jgi:hypothetical protein
VADMTTRPQDERGADPSAALRQEIERRPSWTCFHCGETFTTVGAAQDHFGATPENNVGCLIDRVALEEGGKPERGRGLLMALRKAEAENLRLHEMERQLWWPKQLLQRAEAAESKLTALDGALKAKAEEWRTFGVNLRSKAWANVYRDHANDLDDIRVASSASGAAATTKEQDLGLLGSTVPSHAGEGAPRRED